MLPTWLVNRSAAASGLVPALSAAGTDVLQLACDPHNTVPGWLAQRNGERLRELLLLPGKPAGGMPTWDGRRANRKNGRSCRASRQGVRLQATGARGGGQGEQVACV